LESKNLVNLQKVSLNFGQKSGNKQFQKLKTFFKCFNCFETDSLNRKTFIETESIGHFHAGIIKFNDNNNNFTIQVDSEQIKNSDLYFEILPIYLNFTT
jgi:hypothetical protein